jgi:aspartyl-tRNA(Asn)/glutamyl-tRNA(Gln) amidotransferase subunit A
MKTSIINLSIDEVGTLLAQRSISATELVEETLQRIEETEPIIHAYALVMADQARAAATAADSERATGQVRGPLHGIPIAVKDLCYTKGVPTEAGSRVLAGFVPAFDAMVVRRLHDAGAIVIGKTVTHEFAYGVNEPPTRSPWLHEGYPGGSSAGSGAAVAARSAFGALGTDTGGSIREPAALNGLVGMKPTYGLVGRSGIVPLSQSMDHAGPISRTVKDCAIMLHALAGYDPDDLGSITVPDTEYIAGMDGGVAGLTIGVDRDFFFREQVREEVRRAIDAVIDELAQQGARIVEVAMPELELMETVGLTILLAEASANARHILRDQAADLDANTRRMFELGELLPATHYVTAQRARTVLKDATRNLYLANGLDALISPTLPSTTYPIDIALKVDESGEDPMSAALKYSIAANVTGLPALTVPCGLSSSGLPIGFQLMGRPFAESTLFRIAHGYERSHSWHMEKPKLEVRVAPSL